MNRKHLLLILRLSCLCLFAGRAWQHIVWDAPFRVFFWDEGLLKPIIEPLFQISWDSYATSTANDTALTRLSQVVGFFYAACALLCIAPLSVLKRFRFLLPLASASLAFLAFLYSKDKFYEIGMFIEYASQFLAPLFLYSYSLCSNEDELPAPRILLIMKLSIALTFVGHGLYAAGFYPVPGTFIDMTINMLGVSQGVAVKFLFVAGIMDFLVGALVFVPRFDRYALLYAAVWGLLTSLARTTGYFDSHMILASLNQWFPETIMRMPQAGIPFCVYLAVETQAAVRLSFQASTRSSQV